MNYILVPNIEEYRQRREQQEQRKEELRAKYLAWKRGRRGAATAAR